MISQVLRWAEETERPLAPASALPASAAVEKTTEPPPELSNETVAVVPPAPLADRPAALPHSEIEEPEETWVDQDVSVISQSVRWVEDAKPGLPPESISAAPAAANQNPDSGTKRPSPKNVDAPAAIPNVQSAPLRAEAQLVKDKETGESTGEKKEALKIRLQRFAEKVEQPLRTAPASTAPARIAQRGESRPPKIAAEQANVPTLPDKGSQTRQAEVQKSDQKAKPAPRAKKKDTLQNRFMRWLYPEPVAGPADRRRTSRHRARGLVAYYYTGGAPKPHRIGDISTTGFYLLTEERWLPDTIIRMTLQRAGTDGDDPEDAISVVSKIVRCGTDGVGSEFILADTPGTKHGNPMPGSTSSREDLERFLHS